MARRSAAEHVTGRPKKRGPKRQYNRLGKRIAALDKSQAKLARVLDVSQQTVSKKLLGQCYINIADLEMLAVHYGVHISYFFEDWTPPTRKIRARRRRPSK